MLKCFTWVFRLGLFQLMCKASLIFKSNLLLALSKILKQLGLYLSKQLGLDERCLKM